MRHVGPQEKSFLKTKATSLRDEVSCLQRDQSYVVGGVYILRGSMELRESLGTPPLFGILPSAAEPSVLLSFSRLCLTHTYIHTRTYTEWTHVRSSVQSFSRGRSAELFSQQRIDVHPRLLLRQFDRRCKFRTIRGDNNLSYAND